MQFDNEATICAIATGHENGCRGAIRIAGWTTLSVIQQCHAMTDSLSAITRPTRIPIDWDLGAPLGSIPVDIWYWPTKRSYTGMPSAELHTLGNQVLLNRIVEQLCQAGARLAMPGEFTLRAFLAGRMDLTQCEAVLGVIEAESLVALDVSLRQLAGGLSGPLADLRRLLIELLADIEAGLDFVDEDIVFISREQVIERLETSLASVDRLHQQIIERQPSKVVPKVTFLGRPNAGKSSLVNAIAKDNAAIVNAEAGTTRDFVRVRCEFEHGDVDLIDTAGIDDLSLPHDTLQSIHQSAQRHTAEQRDEADLMLYCIDGNQSNATRIEQLKIACDMHASTGAQQVASEKQSRESRILQHKVWIVWTKSDLETSVHGMRIDKSMVDNSFEHVSSDDLMSVKIPEYVTSCRDGCGIEALRARLSEWRTQRNDEISSVAPMTATRCKASLQSTLESLQTARHAAQQELGDEIVAGEIRLALEQLAQVAGDVYTDDILDALFSRFCIGK
ncbi:MAG: GTPase [Pirellulaceae bacterium]|nr:GTPase [Pirellulaceae bacterium]